ncbi:MAG: prepilin-type N-terminal cleavage/methylation domain-containing protein [Pseudomonadota bacterium]
MTACRPRNRAKDGGLSLLELLVAVSLLGLLGTMVAGGVRFGTAVWERSADGGEAAIATRAATRAISRLLADARPIRRADGTLNPPVLFRGTSTEVSLIAAIPAALAPPGPHRVALGIETGPHLHHRHIVLSAVALQSDRAEVSEVVLDDVDAISFRYFGPSADGSASTWWSEWIDREALPRTIEMTVIQGEQKVVVAASVSRAVGSDAN